MKRVMKRFLMMFLLVVLTRGAPAHSQEEPEVTFSHTFDMSLPAASVASCPGPLSMGYNPAGLAWAPDFDLLYLHHERLDQISESDRALSGGSDGLFLKLGSIGLGLQYVRPYRDLEELDYLKYTLAAPLIVRGGWLSIGYGVEILDPTETSEDPSIDFFVGTMIRPLRYLSLGLVGRNLGRGSILEKRSVRSLDLGVAVRPLWFAPERLTLAVDYRMVAEDPQPPLRFTGHFTLLNGISLFGTADLDGNFGMGLTVDFQRVGAGGYVDFSNKAEVEPDNLLLMARISSQNHPGFILGKQRTAEYLLNHELTSDPQEAWGVFRSRPTLYGLIGSIARAAEDVRIDSLLIKIEDPDLEWSDVQELRQALADFKAAGKKVIFHIESVDNHNYYLASIGDAVYVAPEGRFGFDLKGPSVQATFFRGTLDLIGARPEFERVGKYKSYVEVFANEEPSEPYREVMNSLADELADQMYSGIAEGRKLTRQQVQAVVDTGLMTPKEAQDAGLIDGVIYYDQMDGQLGEILGHRSARMANYLSQRWHTDRWGSLPVVAVVHVRGKILTGASPFGKDANGRQIAEILSDLRVDRRVDAVVLRVNSPGGSILGSDLIWREVVRLRVHKPVIVSMGPVAASGGYYISCAANAIVSNAATITGSIGVLVMFWDLSELFSKIGISHAVVKRGAHADIDSLHRGRSPEEMALLEKVVKADYQNFIERVADGRQMDISRVDAVGQGRVWTGRQAKEKGLVDELGGLEQAIALARQKAGLAPDEDIRIVHLPRARFSLGRLLQELGVTTDETAILPQAVRTSLGQMAWLSTMSAEPVVALLPFLITIK